MNGGGDSCGRAKQSEGERQTNKGLGAARGLAMSEAAQVDKANKNSIIGYSKRIIASNFERGGFDVLLTLPLLV